MNIYYVSVVRGDASFFGGFVTEAEDLQAAGSKVKANHPLPTGGEMMIVNLTACAEGGGEGVHMPGAQYYDRMLTEADVKEVWPDAMRIDDFIEQEDRAAGKKLCTALRAMPSNTDPSEWAHPYTYEDNVEGGGVGIFCEMCNACVS